MTPEVNIDAHKLVTGNIKSYYAGDLLSDVDVPGITTTHMVKYRPASTSNPKSALDGWRNPSAWYTYGWLNNPNPIGTLTCITTSDLLGVQVYSDGAGWNNVGDVSPPTYLSDTIDRALKQALTRLKDSKVNLATNLAEYKDVSDLAVHTFTLAKSLVKTWKGKYFKDFLKASTVGLKRHRLGNGVQNFPNSFLEVQYAVKPLYADLHGAAAALERRHQTSPGCISVVGRATTRDRLTWHKSTSVSANAGFLVTQTLVNKAKVRLDYFLRNDGLRSLAQLGFTNPLSLAWEELPFSFIADWGVPLGQYLEQLDADYGLEFRGGSWSSKVQLGFDGFFKVFEPGLPIQSWNGGDYRYRGFRFTRGVYGESPSPPWGLKSPFDSGGQHVANAIALLSGALTGHLPRNVSR